MEEWKSDLDISDWKVIMIKVDKLIREISDKTYVRLRLKGRGKTAEGVRLNELVVTIEPK